MVVDENSSFVVKLFSFDPFMYRLMCRGKSWTYALRVKHRLGCTYEGYLMGDCIMWTCCYFTDRVYRFERKRNYGLDVRGTVRYNRKFWREWW